MGMALVGVEASGGGGKKIRKPYTITKSRENWSDQEHDKFLEALQLFDRDWKKIEAFVGSKTVIQIRSHAQKYFLKVQKNGTREHVPPPRPKKKAAHPYPQKAPKNVSVSEGQSVFISASQPELEYFQLPESSSMLQNSDEVGSVPMRAMRVCSNGNMESSHTWQPQQKILDGESDGIEVRVKPNFAEVYQFIGSVFDPKTTDHIKQLQKMDPTDLTTVLLLMRNLSVNLSRPEFEEQKVILSSYDPNTQEDGEGLENQADDKMALPFTGAVLPQKRLTGLHQE